ncbi:MAG TPA: hypothetical protein VGG74_26445 [Kofleriaceae bacterium]
MKATVLVLMIAACGAPAATTTTTTTTTATPPATAATCDSVKPRVESLYRAEGQQREPKRVDEYVSDNTTMIMNDCVTNPAKFAPCLAAAATVAQMEQECVIPLDDEGTEGEVQ